MRIPESEVKAAILLIPGVRAVHYNTDHGRRLMVVSVKTATGRKTGTIRCERSRVDTAEAENLLRNLVGGLGVVSFRQSMNTRNVVRTAMGEVA